MRGILINSTTLGGRTYTYRDISKGIFACAFPQDKFYGGRVTRWGKTANGLLLCLDGFYEIVIDIFVDFAALDELDTKTLRAIAEAVRARKLLNTPADRREAVDRKLAIPKAKYDLAEFIRENAVDIISNEPEPQAVHAINIGPDGSLRAVGNIHNQQEDKAKAKDKAKGKDEDPGGKVPGMTDQDDNDPGQDDTDDEDPGEDDPGDSDQGEIGEISTRK
ncbi:MAG TPA: hypothetical protein PLP87_09040 [Clostridiales bacterium]|nr:hypothetical protein [Clostridiales bacterium]